MAVVRHTVQEHNQDSVSSPGQGGISGTRPVGRRGSRPPGAVELRARPHAPGPRPVVAPGPVVIGLVLAAGAGRRLRPYTDTLPKTLVPIADGATVLDGPPRHFTQLRLTPALPL